MVPPASDRVPRVRPYSGATCVSSASRTGLLPPMVELSRSIPLAYLNHVRWSATPKCMHLGLASSRFARRYFGNRVFFLFLRVLRCFSSPRSPRTVMYWLYDTCALPHVGSPIRTSAGITDMCSLPQLFAAYHVLHRLPVPRHPPDALLNLTKCLLISSHALSDFVSSLSYILRYAPSLLTCLPRLKRN